MTSLLSIFLILVPHTHTHTHTQIGWCFFRLTVLSYDKHLLINLSSAHTRIHGNPDWRLSNHQPVRQPTKNKKKVTHTHRGGQKQVYSCSHGKRTQVVTIAVLSQWLSQCDSEPALACPDIHTCRHVSMSSGGDRWSYGDWKSMSATCKPSPRDARCCGCWSQSSVCCLRPGVLVAGGRFSSSCRK